MGRAVGDTDVWLRGEIVTLGERVMGKCIVDSGEGGGSGEIGSGSGEGGGER